MVAEREQITSLRKPPPGWFWSSEARARRQNPSHGGDNRQASSPYNPRYNGQAPESGPRADAEPTVKLPTFRADDPTRPQACIFCRSRLLNVEPPIGWHQRGQVTCGTCGRGICWLSAPVIAIGQRRTPVVTSAPRMAQIGLTGRTVVPAIRGRFNRRPSCGRLCTVQAGHDAETHEQYGRAQALEEIAAKPTGIVRTGNLTVDLGTEAVTVDGVAVYPPPLALAVLLYLAARPGRLCPHRDVVRAVWDEETAQVWSGYLANRWQGYRMQVKRLRERLGTAGRLIESPHCSEGYLLRAEPPTGGAS